MHFKSCARSLSRDRNLHIVSDMVISAPNANVTSDTSLTLIKEKVESEKKLNETIEATTKTENSLNLKIASLEAQLTESKNE